MDVNAALELFGLSVLMPAVTALVAAWLSRRVLPEDAATRYPSAVGFAAGFVTGYVLLPDWAVLVPERHWHWLPYLAAAAAIIGPVGQAQGVSAPERWLLILLVAIAAGWFLVPTWSSLTPSRAVWLTVLTATLFLLIVLSDPLPQRVGSRSVLWSLTLTALVVAMMVAACVSVTYARLGGIAAGSLAGLCAADWWSRDVAAVRSLIPAAMISVAGIAFVGAVDPQPPLIGLMMLPAAPLGLWLRRIAPLGNPTGIRGLAVEAAIVIVPLVVISLSTYYSV